jgi:ubiquinone biosynthesis protein UbiJ|tara:strand:+ start:309 stop:548 length:240 start_codon:yes stop_codon:yes gene_type:complete
MTINLDRGLNDLEDSIDRLIKQKEYLQKQLRKTKDRSEEIMALYAEVKRLKNENEILQTNLHKMKTLHNAKVLEKMEDK